MLKDELRQLLRELATVTGAVTVSIAHPEQADLLADAADGIGRLDRTVDESSPAMSVPIGGGAVLRAGFVCPEEPPDACDPNGRAAALERTARALRACARRWDVATLPPLAIPEGARSPQTVILDRIQTYLRALVASVGMDNAAVTLRGRLLTSAAPLGELHHAQIPFTARRVGLEADRRRGQRGSSSHGELCGDDFYAMSFWYGACLVGFFVRPYSPDFVRHRTRQVARELAHLLSLLDEPGHDPVQTAPRP